MSQPERWTIQKSWRTFNGQGQVSGPDTEPVEVVPASRLEQAVNSAEIDGFQKGLKARDDQIREGALPEGVDPPSEALQRRLEQVEKERDEAVRNLLLQESEACRLRDEALVEATKNANRAEKAEAALASYRAAGEKPGA